MMHSINDHIHAIHVWSLSFFGSFMAFIAVPLSVWNERLAFVSFLLAVLISAPKVYNIYFKKKEPEPEDEGE